MEFPIIQEGQEEEFLKTIGWHFGEVIGDLRQNNVPLVTIGIISFNRCTALRFTLKALLAVAYPNIEIIVVDNASSDGTDTMVAEEFPAINFLKLSENTGTSARNIFLKKARGSYIFCYDDDSIPAAPDTISKIIGYMENNPDIAALSTNCYQPRTGIEETVGWEMFSRKIAGNVYEGVYILEGGVCFRTSALAQAGYYDEENLWGAEGTDLALQFLKNGQRMVLHRDFTTLHFKHWAGRPKNRDTHWKTQNMIFMLAKHFPLWAFLPLSFGYVLRRFVGIAIRPKTAVGVFKGILKGYSGAGEFIKRDGKLTLRQMHFLKRWYLMLYRW